MDIAAAIVTTPIAFAAGFAAGDYMQGRTDSMEPAQVAATGVSVTALALTVPVSLAVSAIWGYRTANRCASYQTEYAARVDAHRLTVSHE
jgi:hypothetical protein